MTLYLATGNLHKKKEMQEICRGHTILIPSDKGIDFNPIENGNGFFENALIKARALWEIVKEPVLADDSGICVDILGGAPGIYSARYAGSAFPKGRPDGTKIPQEEQNRLLLQAVDEAVCAAVQTAEKTAQPLAAHKAPLSADKARRCRYVCAMVLYLGKERFYCVQETFEGTLIENIEQSRGQGGFGYDPIVFLSEYGKTVAELSDEEKNKMSHRGKAARKILQLL
ncbi:non-canonical purine NTP pyrophosphatase [Treponema sp. OMZ 840]|uniref:non-canonical purine NTP pyrophosphatase n=1 Tax=Treponema sp. OMZ 840 TaxID=244313 RepID=UPI003D90AF6B